MNELSMAAIVVRCGKTHKLFGMSLKEISSGEWYAYWSFPLSDGDTKNDDYTLTEFGHDFDFDPKYPGCPYCGSRGVHLCAQCGHFSCWDLRQRTIPCQWCGSTQTASFTVTQGIQPSIPVKSETGSLVIDLGNGVTMDFVHVPAGEFLMGVDGSIDPRFGSFLGPPHKVYLDDYWIGKFPVTNRQYYHSTQYGQVDHHEYDSELDLESHEKFPVVGLSWVMAKDFCEKVSRISGKKVYLPSEAQWEKAARGTDGRLYPWGNEPPTAKLANFGGNKRGVTKIIGITDVDHYPAGCSPYGAMDMAGNWMEWVADWFEFDYYQQSPYSNPTGPAEGLERAVRGGTWLLDEFYIISAQRWAAGPEKLSNGFRCALSL